MNWGPKSAPAAGEHLRLHPDRALGAWLDAQPGHGRESLQGFLRRLKPGGILAVEQHRANPGPQDLKAASGYVTEAFVIEQAQKAGFKLAARSEINANPKDTKDHPFGVWTLPPTLRSTPYGSDATDPPSITRSTSRSASRIA